MSIGRSTIALAALGLLCAGPSAAHDDGRHVPGRYYVEVGGGAEYVNLPKLTIFADGDRNGVGPTDDEFSRWTSELVLGFADPEGLSLPDPIGRNARIQGRVRYSKGTTDRSDATQPLRISRVEEPFVVTNFFPQEYALDTNSELETWDADVTYRTDVWLSDQLSLTPIVGITYTRMKFDNDFKATGLNGFVFRQHEINDHTRTHYYGGVLGAELTARPVPTVAVVAGLRADLMGATSAMRVNQHLFVGDNDVRNAESDNDTNFAGRATASLGVDLRLGPLEIGAEGYASYLSYFPVADHRRQATGRPSNIDGEEMWSAGAMASLTLWFP